jgi:hypothetical protein
LGHAFGRNHAHAYKCVNSSGVPVTISTTCTDVNGGYGDTIDIMGAGQKQFNAYNKTTASTPTWFDAGNITTLTNASQAGDYTLAPYEPASSSPQVLRIARGDGMYYTFEFRQGSTIDYYGAGSPTMSGVIIHLTPDFGSGSNSFLLDATPGSNPTGVLDDFVDAALSPGHSFTDATAGIRVAVTAISPNTGATVHVDFDPSVCTLSPPVINATPLNQTGGARQTFGYQLSLRNQDLTACYGSTYNISISVPPKWSGIPGSFSESLMPGESVIREFTVAPPASVRKGTYGITAKAVNSVKKTKAASAQTTVTIN